MQLIDSILFFQPCGFKGVVAVVAVTPVRKVQLGSHRDLEGRVVPTLILPLNLLLIAQLDRICT
jgi:hypothetical protein